MKTKLLKKLKTIAHNKYSIKPEYSYDLYYIYEESNGFLIKYDYYHSQNPEDLVSKLEELRREHFHRLATEYLYERRKERVSNL